MKKLFVASEIAKMGLPGVPSTKANVIAKAEREGWYYEERKGLGGTRRAYEIPARYLAAAGEAGELPPIAPKRQGKVVGTVAAGTAKVDPQLLQIAEEAFEEWQRERGLSLDPRRRGAVVAVLYDYLAQGADQEAAANMLRVIGGD